MGDDAASASDLLLRPREVVARADAEQRMQDALAELASLSLRADEARREADALEAESAGDEPEPVDTAATAEALEAARARQHELVDARRSELDAALAEAQVEAEHSLLTARREARMLVADASRRLQEAAGLEPSQGVRNRLVAPVPAPGSTADRALSHPATGPLAAADAPVLLAYLVTPGAGGGVAGDLSLGPGHGLPGYSVAAPTEGAADPAPWWRRLLHLDVVLPVLVAIIVLVVLLAWVG